MPLIIADSIPPVFPPPFACAYGEDRYGYHFDFDVSGILSRMRWIPPGIFQMGSPESEQARSDSELQHEVTLTEGFWLGETTCTQKLWKATMGENPSRFNEDDKQDLPVESISWNDVQIFFEKLESHHSDLKLRLPSEAEWEYACRGRKHVTTPFHFGENITTDQANYDGNYPYAGVEKGEYRECTIDVKKLPCNDWGLYQMHGNVWEWCKDWYSNDYYKEGQSNPTGPETGAYRVLRGGSWIDSAGYVRCEYRLHFLPSNRNNVIGFRFAWGQENKNQQDG